MKKIIAGFVFVSVSCLQGFCAELACKDSDYAFMSESRYIHVFTIATGAKSVIDNETITIDRKNQTVTFWFVNQLEKGSESGGYLKSQRKIDIKNRRMMNLRIIAYSCKGSVDADVEASKQWEDIAPATVNEVIFSKIKKIYDNKK
jgi:hypothetical protein